MRKDGERREAGTLIDFHNGADCIRSLLPAGFPLRISAEENPAHSAGSLLRQLEATLAARQYDRAVSLLDWLRADFPVEGQRVTEQLAFLLSPSPGFRQRRQYWKQHAAALAWQSDLWRLLSQDSPLTWQPPEDLELAVEEFTEAEPEPPAIQSSGSSHARGALLEQLVKQLLKKLFDLDDEENTSGLEHLRVQGAGNQFGFDVTFTYRDRFGTEITCMVECKNYQDRQIRLSNVADKLVSLKNEGNRVDHWILISPHSRVSNELSLMKEPWRERDEWHPIMDVQFWTPDEQVWELFGLFPELYAKIYDEGRESDPASWSNEKRREVLARWKGKLAPVPWLPQSWKRYLREPQYLLTQREADRDTIRDYDELYRCRAPVGLLDETELPIDGTAEDYFLRWLRKPDTRCALLLGDFGDGKTFFTYTLARQLSKEFLKAPDGWWIPLRLSLRELGDQPMDCREFLNQRLREFCEGPREWNEVQSRYRFLIILDGLDEMSLKMNDTVVLDNLAKLEGLLEQFQGHKILVTSRRMAIYADRIRDRILTSLEQPEVLHLAPVALGDRLDFLTRLADTPKRRQRLLDIQRTHDLLGLAAKPLFLDIMRILLDEDSIHVLDAAGIYEDYAEKVLARKQRIQLAMPGDHTHPDATRRKLICLLEELALCLQYRGTDSISLEEFKTHIEEPNLAQLLWESVDGLQGEECAEDADRRLSNRSLLKYDCMNPEHRCFCHRSMKEYFVARGVVRRLWESEDESRSLLTTCDLGYEILAFAGKELQRLEESSRRLAAHRLALFAHETRGKQEHPQREAFARLGVNSVNLLHQSGVGLEGADWSGLVLDGLVLSGANLAGKDFSYCSMRYAHLDNADLTGCDLRGCDFTGVQFEKSGQLRAFAPLPRENGLLACYHDGKLRRWQLSDGAVQTLADLEERRINRLLLWESGREGAILPNKLQFWRRKQDEVTPVGGVVLRQGLQVLDVGETMTLVRQRGDLCLLDLADGALLYQWKCLDNARACLLSNRFVVLWTAEQGLALLDGSSGKPLGSLELPGIPVMALSAILFSPEEGMVVLGCETGAIQCFRLTADSECRQWTFHHAGNALTGGDQVLGTAADGIGGVYIGTSSGTIFRYRMDEQGHLEEERAYRLELKCAGARIEGVKPQEQYMILRQALE
jgi:hypothetical protein